MAYAFGSGTLNYNSAPIGTLQDVSLEVTFNSIPLQGNRQFPVAIAKGPGSVKGSARSGEVVSGIMSSITNQTMEPQAAGNMIQLTWSVPDTDGNDTTFTLHNVLLTSWKIASGSDKWLLLDISFEAAADGTNAVLTVATA